MSSILKALKKVEQDKNLSKPKTLRAQPELRTKDSAIASSTKFFIYSLMFFVLGGTTIYYKMRSQPIVNKAVSSTETVTPKVINIKQQEPKPNDFSANIQQISQQIPAKQANNIHISKKQQNNNTIQTEQTRPQTINSINNTNKFAIPLQIKIPIQKEVVHQVIEKPVLEVNGIAFQSDNRENIAIVNGVPVSQKSIIEGVTVKEIHNNRVTFIKDGKTFDIELGEINGGVKANGQ